MHSVPSPLRETRFIGRLDTGLAERHRVTQHIQPKGLRRLRQKDRLARQGLDYVQLVTRALHPLDRIANRPGHDCRTVTCGRGDRLRNQVRRDERTGSVVDEHHVRT